jgi:ubiquinone/menaquinone biosynthesis C-methylase UbiE
MPDHPSALPLEAAQMYNTGTEAARLSDGHNKLEQVRVQEPMARHLPAAPAVVCDVGGGTGPHALWLAEQGYTVHLLDAMPLHIEQALALDAQGMLASAVVGDARQLPYPDGSADAILLFGPLHHLTEQQARLQALIEAQRVLRPGGVLLAMNVNRFASTFDGLFAGGYADPDFMAMADQDLQDGQHRAPPGKPYFTTTFFHHPDELRSEIEAAGFQIAQLLGVEGIGWTMGDFDAAWEDPVRREWILRVARRLEAEPTLLGASAHVMAVARRPDSR